MKRLSKMVWIVVMAGMLIPVMAAARHGAPPSGDEILAGTPFDVTGEVQRIGHRGKLALTVGEDTVKIAGFGPDRYFEEQGVAYPQVGDTIQVTGYIITHNNREHHVAMNATVDGQVIQFRDPETGEVLWQRPEPFADLLAGTPFDITGEVTSLGAREGMVLSTAFGDATIHGIGPARYWEEMGVDLPEVGETVQVSGYIVQLNDTERHIAFNMVIQDDTIELRDAETGKPLWRAMFGPGHGNKQRMKSEGDTPKTIAR